MSLAVAMNTGHPGDRVHQLRGRNHKIRALWLTKVGGCAMKLLLRLYPGSSCLADAPKHGYAILDATVPPKARSRRLVGCGGARLSPSRWRLPSAGRQAIPGRSGLLLEPSWQSLRAQRFTRGVTRTGAQPCGLGSSWSAHHELGSPPGDQAGKQQDHHERHGYPAWVELEPRRRSREALVQQDGIDRAVYIREHG